MQLDSHVGVDIYKPMHPLRTFLLFTNGENNLQIQKGDSLSWVLN